MRISFTLKFTLISIIGILACNINLYSQTDTLSHYSKHLIELSKVTIVSGNKTPQKLNNTSSTTRIITSNDIRENSYFTLEDALSNLPGFQFRNILGLNSYSFLRGLPRQNNAILILIDGIQINELNSGGFYGGGQYNLANVERIEVIYGPSSVIYGTNAISGIINIITKSPNKQQQLSTNTVIGSFNTHSTDVTYSYLGDKIALQLSGMLKSSDKADLSGNNNDNLWDDFLEIYETDYAFDAKIQIGKFTAGINYQNRQSSTSTSYATVNTNYLGNGSFWNLQLINGYLKYATKISKKIDLQSTLYNRNATVLRNSVDEVTETGQIGYYRPNNLIGLESVFSYKPNNKLNIVSGVFGHYENLANGFSKTYSTEASLKPPQPSAPDMKSNTLIGAFIQSEFSFLKHWKIVPGIRYEYSSNYKDVITPRASILFNKNKISTKLIFAQAFRAPKPWDFFDGIGNPNLQPENFNSYEFSSSYTISNNFNTAISIYKNNLFNGLSRVTTNKNNYYWDNVGNLSTDGIELELIYVNKKIKLFGNYTYNYSEFDTGDTLPEIALHTATIGLNYNFLTHFNFGLRTYYLGKRKNPQIITATNSQYIKPAFVINSTLSLLNYKNADFQLIAKNLTNKEYYHTSNRSSIDRFRQPQFSFSLKIAYNIVKP